MFKLRSFLLFSTIVFSANAAACTYKEAQSKSIQATSLQAEYSKDRVREMQEYGEPLPSNEQLRAGLNEALQSLGLDLAKAYENNPNIQYGDAVSPSLCEGYNGILTKYARKDTQKNATKSAPIVLTKTCDKEQVFDRFNAVNEQSIKLLQAGKLTNADTAEQQLLSIEFGQHFSTDLNKACYSLEQLEAMIAKKSS